jgi:translation initiation factor 2 subunit 2
MDYAKLLKKAKEEMPEVVQEKERFEIPGVKGHVQGTKTMITNLAQIASHIHRPIEHLFKYLLKELATPGDVKSSGTAIFGRKLSSFDLNSKIKQYADEFVFCPDCGKPDTEFVKESGNTFLKCMVCGSKNHLKIKS